MANRIKELENEIYLLQQRDVNLELLKYEDAKEIEALEKHRKMLIDKIELLEKSSKEYQEGYFNSR